jgi:hypothetical protein
MSLPHALHPATQKHVQVHCSFGTASREFPPQTASRVLPTRHIERAGEPIFDRIVVESAAKLTLRSSYSRRLCGITDRAQEKLVLIWAHCARV